MRKLFFGLLAAIVGVFLIAFHNDAVAVDQAKPIKVGVILPLSGPLAWVGEAMRKGIELAARDEKSEKVTFIFQDDLSSNRVTALTAVKALTAVEKVDGLINCSTSTVSAIAPVINQTKTPTLIVWDSNREMPKYSQYIVGFGYMNEQAAEEAAEFLVENKRAKKIAVISYTNDWSELLTRSFIERARALGAEIILQDQVDSSQTEFRTQMVRMKQRGVQGIYLPLFGSGLLSSIKQIREFQINTPVLTVDSLGDAELKALGDIANGIYVSQIILDSSNRIDELALTEEFKGLTLVDRGYTALGFDAARALISVLKEAGLKTSSETMSLFEGRHFNGLLGDVQVNSSRIAERSIPIVQIKDGAFTRD